MSLIGDYSMLFSEMLCKTRDITVETGDLEGVCCICGKHTTTGLKKKFKTNFTAANYLNNAGTVLCPECNYLVQNGDEYRRSMFLLTEHEFRKFKKAEMKDVIFNLPDEPFYLYLTRTWQKNGAIRLNEAYNTSNTGVVRFLVDYDIIEGELSVMEAYCKCIKYLRDLGISKTALETGEFTNYQFNQIIGSLCGARGSGKAIAVERARKVVKKIKKLAGNPVWDLCVYMEK